MRVAGDLKKKKKCWSCCVATLLGLLWRHMTTFVCGDALCLSSCVSHVWENPTEMLLTTQKRGC